MSNSPRSVPPFRFPIRSASRIVFFSFLLAVGLGASSAGAAPEPLVIAPGHDRYNLTSHLEYLEDPEKSWTIEDVSSPAFANKYAPGRGSHLNLGRSNSAYWVRFSLQSAVPVVEGPEGISPQAWVINNHRPHYLSLRMYLPALEPGGGPDGGDWWVQESGFLRENLETPQQKRIVFRMREIPEKPTTYYMRFESDGPILISPDLVSEPAYMHGSKLRMWCLGVYYGILIALAIYNLFIFFSMRDVSYLWYVSYLFFAGMATQAINSIGYELFMKSRPQMWIRTALECCMGLAFMMFAQLIRSFFHTARTLPRIDKILLAYIAFGFCGIGLYLISRPQLGVTCFFILGLTIPILGVWSAIASWRSGYSLARWFLLAWAVYAAFTFWYSLTLFGALPWTKWGFYVTQFGQAMESLLLAFALNERIKILHWEKTMAETASKAKSDFLANVSHELRTPLNAILGYTQILKRDRPLMENKGRQIEAIHNSGEHLLNLINDILELSKIEAGQLDLHLDRVPLKGLFRNLIAMIQIRAEARGLAFVFEESPALPEGAMADEKRLRQVLLNLLSNAVNYTDRGLVRFSAIPVGPVAFANGKAGVRIRFEVEDTGQGIPEERLEEIFQPFRQVSESVASTEGAGLGLPISRSLVRLMGSDLFVKSEPGKGSSFWFELDLETVESVERGVREDAPIVGYEGPPRRLLLVDDNDYNRAVLRAMVEPLGFEIFEAADGAEGMENAAAESPDMILLDLLMPKMGGHEMAARIRKERKWDALKIVAISASVDAATRQKALEAGCNDFLPKPVGMDKLLAVLQRNLDLVWRRESGAEPKAQTKKEAAAELICPPEEVMKALLEFAEKQNYSKLNAELNGLAGGADQYGAFVDEVRSRLNAFNFKGIGAFLKERLK